MSGDSFVGLLVRIRLVEDGRWVWFELPDGRTGWLDSDDADEVNPGDVVLISDRGRIDDAPSDLWREDSWISVVRRKTPEKTLLEYGGNARLVPTSDVPYEEGNTVEVRNSTGVVSVLDNRPLRLLDTPEIDDAAAARFIDEKTDDQETFADFGGHADLVDRARQLIETPLRHREALKRMGARQVRGVLFTGDPGTGKTMLARIIANESGATFYSISGPEIVSKWYGQSEELLRSIFKHASEQESAIIFFDEIDSIASQRNEDAHEASRRLVAQMLTLMDGFSKTRANIVVIATTNRPQDIDVALRRPGRFDWEIYFPPPNRQDRELVLLSSSRHLRTAGVLPIREIADRTDGWSAAEVTMIWTEAALLAAEDHRDEIMAEDCLGGYANVRAQRDRARTKSEATAN